MEQATCFTYARSAVWGSRTDSLVRPIWMMKDTPSGLQIIEGIVIPTCPAVGSTIGKGAWGGIEGMDMGGPVCITAEPGGEAPAGGKKTWDIAPEDMQGLALAIQSPLALPCRLPGALSIHRDKHTPWWSGGFSAKSHTHSNCPVGREEIWVSTHWAESPCSPLGR